MNNRLKSLSNAIHMRNEFNRVAAPIVEFVKEQSKPFIGKKIGTLKGLAAKYAEAVHIDRDKHKVNPLPGTKWAKMHLTYTSVSYGDVQIKISICFSDGSTGCTYRDRTFYFGKIDDDQKLISINEDCKPDSRVLEYDTELAKIKTFRELEKKAEDAKDEILIDREAYQYIGLDNFGDE